MQKAGVTRRGPWQHARFRAPFVVPVVNSAAKRRAPFEARVSGRAGPVAPFEVPGSSGVWWGTASGRGGGRRRNILGQGGEIRGWWPHHVQENVAQLSRVRQEAQKGCIAGQS